LLYSAFLKNTNVISNFGVQMFIM